jgi:hypothetical protein
MDSKGRLDMNRSHDVKIVLWLLCMSSLLGGATCGDDTPPTPPGACDPTDVAPVTHTGDISADETWAKGVHVVPSTITLRAGARLTIAACTEVRLGRDASLVADTAAAGIVAEGTTAEPIRFVRDAAADAWGALVAWAPATLSLAHAALIGGGTNTALASADYLGASLVARAPGDAAADVLRVDTVSVSDSTGIGVVLIGAGFDALSTNLTVTGSGAQPVYLGADNATNLPTGTYTGNALDEILLQQVGVAAYSNDRPLIRDATLRERGVPYRVGAEGAGGASLIVGDGRETGPAAVLTIEPGVTLRFSSEGVSQLLVNAHLVGGTWAPQGALIANGTAAAPITFTTSATTPIAGSWSGLYFSHVVDPRSSISNAIIDYAGGESLSTGVCVGAVGASNSDADGAVILFLESNAAPPTAFISATHIAHSAGCGFYRDWQTTDVDFVSGNTFEAIAGCLQTNVPNDLNICPTTDCPML